ncbi:MAG: Ldh family oxidoreductase [Pseudomonadota bacterium]
MAVVEADGLQALVAETFVAAGCAEAEAGQVAASLVLANLSGHDSHGVARVPRYLEWIGERTIRPGNGVEVIRETPVISVLDGQYGFGQVVAPQAIAIAIEKCRTNGLSAVALKNAGHVGRVGEWAEMAADAGFVSIHHVNAPQSLLVAPFGAISARFSTAPYACGVPREDGDHLILDFATSVVAEGKVLVASQGGKALPDNALVSEDGTIGGDPRYLYGDYEPDGPRSYHNGKGAIRAMGDHKGSGLAFMVELLGGSLTGTGAPDPERPVWANGMFSVLVDPKVLNPDGFFPTDVSRYLSYYKTAQPIEPGGAVLAPGEPERQTRVVRRRDGVPIPDGTWSAIRTAASSQGLATDRIDAIVMAP